MLVIQMLVSLSLLQDPKPATTGDAQVKTAVHTLKAAFAGHDAAARQRAIDAAATIADGEVVALIARGLADADVAVQHAAIEALRFQTHERALAALHTRALAREAKDDLAVYAALLRAIGQHGSATSIDILTDNPWSTPDARVLQARILGLGRIHTPAAVKALVGVMEIAGSNRVEPFMGDVRLALWALTGSDQGESRDLWLHWYRQRKDTLRVRSAPLAEPADLAGRWTSYWSSRERWDRDAAARPSRHRGR